MRHPLLKYLSFAFFLDLRASDVSSDILVQGFPFQRRDLKNIELPELWFYASKVVHSAYT